MTPAVRVARSRWRRTTLLVVAIGLSGACGGEVRPVGRVRYPAHKSEPPPWPERVSQAPGFLNRGVIVDRESGAVFLSAVEGIEAVDLLTGARRWFSTSAAKPLFVRGGRLLAQQDATSAGVLPLVLLEGQTGGLAVRCGRIELPEWATPSIEERRGNVVSVGALDRDGRIQVLWFATRGVAGVDLRQANGNVEVDPTSGAVRRVGPIRDATTGVGTSEGMKNGFSAGEVQATLESRPVEGRYRAVLRRHRRSDGADLPPIEIGTVGSESLAFLVSADARHVLVSEAAESRGLWSIVSIETGERVGSLSESPREFLVVRGLVVRGGPPLEFVHALDLRSGREIWRRPLRAWWWRASAGS